MWIPNITLARYARLRAVKTDVKSAICSVNASNLIMYFCTQLKAYHKLLQAAKKGHTDAMEMIARAYLVCPIRGGGQILLRLYAHASLHFHSSRL